MSKIIFRVAIKLHLSYSLFPFSAEKATPLDQDTESTQASPIPNMPNNNAVSNSSAASLGSPPSQSPILHEEDELSETGESEGEDEDEGPGPHGVESETEVTEVDMSDMDMNKVF